jgi:Protein of unknown function (DUF3681)
MAYNFASGWNLPAGAFDPEPEPATLATNLVSVAIHIASSVVVSMLRPLPCAVMALDVCIGYAFYVGLGLIFLFGLGMLLVGWLLADNPTRYYALGRAMMRASHVVLVFAIALRQAPSASMTPANTTSK